MTSAGNEIRKEAYQKLGKLFYAVAAADKSVHVKEIEKLREIIRKEWVAVDDAVDEYGTDAAFQIESVFDWLLEYEKTSEEAFQDFETYFSEHKKLFDSKTKDLTMKTARVIAASFHGSNKAELAVLGKLQLLFDA